MKRRIQYRVAVDGRGRVFFKAHVQAFDRVDPRTGKMVHVGEYDDKRTKKMVMPTMQRPAAAQPPQSQPRPAAQPQGGGHRLVTLHDAGPDSPGRTIRMQPHPERPGTFRPHPDDMPHARAAMGQPMGQPAGQGPIEGQNRANGPTEAGQSAGQGAGQPVEREPVDPPPPGDFYAPDPAEGKASRVGVPANDVPPPPPIPRLPNLAPDEREAETAFADAYQADPDGMARQLRELMAAGKVGDGANIFATDDAKVLSGHWNPQGVSDEQRLAARALYNTAVHQTSNALAKRAFVQHLDEVVGKFPEGDKRRHVLVTAGGVAAGKGYALGNIDVTKALTAEVGAVWDSAGEQNSTECEWVFGECQKRGIPVTFAYVHADPLTTWENPERGVVERAKKKGRMVDARAFADSYAYGSRNFAAFAKSVKENPAANVFVIDNASGKPKLLDDVPHAALMVDPEALYKRCIDHLSEGDLSHAIRRAGTAGLRIWGQLKQTAGAAGQRAGEAIAGAAAGGTAPGPAAAGA